VVFDRPGERVANSTDNYCQWREEPHKSVRTGTTTGRAIRRGLAGGSVRSTPRPSGPVPSPNL
jgi:hypothetical protein